MNPVDETLRCLFMTNKKTERRKKAVEFFCSCLFIKNCSTVQTHAVQSIGGVFVQRQENVDSKCI